MPVLRYKNKNGEWVKLYVDDIKNRLRVDKNLSDLQDVNKARDNLGINILEREIGNIALKLNQEDIFPDYNTLVLEDFQKGETETDRATVNVTTVVAGSRYIDVDDLENIKKGSIYTISDGNSSESVQVADIEKVDDAYRLTLMNPVQNSYGEAILYRSTATTSTGVIEGTTSNKNIQYESNTEWSGSGANVEVTEMLDFSLSNKDNFECSSNIAFSSGGKLTVSLQHRFMGIALVANNNWVRINHLGEVVS